VWRRQVASFEGPGGQQGQVRAAWWHEQQDEVMDGFLVAPQNQGRAGTTWEPSLEWRLAEATPSSRGFQWFTRKPLGSLVDPQTRTEEPKTEMQQLWVGLTGGSDRSDWWVLV
jgi:hypothetical protein